MNKGVKAKNIASTKKGCEMNNTEKFHSAKSNLESALIEFLQCAMKDERDLEDEINEALFNSSKEAGCKNFKVMDEW